MIRKSVLRNVAVMFAAAITVIVLSPKSRADDHLVFRCKAPCPVINCHSGTGCDCKLEDGLYTCVGLVPD